MNILFEVWTAFVFSRLALRLWPKKAAPFAIWVHDKLRTAAWWERHLAGRLTLLILRLPLPRWMRRSLCAPIDAWVEPIEAWWRIRRRCTCCGGRRDEWSRQSGSTACWNCDGQYAEG